jgi:hypothetical protein
MKCTVLAIALGGAGCATGGSDFDATNVRNLDPGVSTMDDAVRMFGNPMTCSTQADGSSFCMWMYSKAVVAPLPFYTAMDTRSKSLMLYFDKDGKFVPENPVITKARQDTREMTEAAVKASQSTSTSPPAASPESPSSVPQVPADAAL